jgi:ribosome-binding protein aMBF1 (putative translation factor)
MNDEMEDQIAATVDEIVEQIRPRIERDADRLGISQAELADRIKVELSNMDWE